jgi:hypothetical protein
MAQRKIKKYILFTIPALWVSKENPVSEKVREAVDRCLGEALGRCFWRYDGRYLATSEQFGELVVSLMQMPDLDLTKMEASDSRFITTTKAVTEDYCCE